MSANKFIRKYACKCVKQTPIRINVRGKMDVGTGGTCQSEDCYHHDRLLLERKHDSAVNFHKSPY